MARILKLKEIKVSERHVTRASIIFYNNNRLTKHEVSQRRKEILETKQWTDCKFEVGLEPEQEIIEAHKLILAMSSHVFEAMFSGDTAENEGPIRVTDIQPATFKALLDYVYTENIKLESFELACELCYCANKYMFPFLDTECMEFIMKNLSAEKVCRAYELSKLLAKFGPTIKCLEIIRAKTDEVLKQKSFEEIESETLLMILEQDELKITSEIELFYAAERWAKAECVRRGLDAEDERSMRSVLGKSLTKIRFLTLSLQEFAEICGNSSLLDKTATVAILGNIVPGKLKHTMPEGFSSSVKKRGLQIAGIHDSTKTIIVKGNEIGDGREYYCNTMILPRRLSKVSISSLSRFDEIFTVDKRIWLIGIQIYSQFRDDVWSYTESLKVELRKEYKRSGTIATTNFTANVESGTLIKVTFEQPQLIESNTEHTLTITFKKVGSYLTFPCQNEIFCEPVLFKFREYWPRLENRKMISSIIFTPQC